MAYDGGGTGPVAQGDGESFAVGCVNLIVQSHSIGKGERNENSHLSHPEVSKCRRLG